VTATDNKIQLLPPAARNGKGLAACFAYWLDMAYIKDVAESAAASFIFPVKE
jgi:hypothetical protein